MSTKHVGTKDTNGSFGSDQLRLVSFTVGQECFAVDILSVQEINRMMELTQVPQSPPDVCGVINLRGKIVPVLDLRTRFGIEATQQNEASRIIVVDIRNITVGFIVDEVHEVLRIDPNIIDPAPGITGSADSSYISGVAKLNDRLLIMLDLDQLMSSESLETIGAVGAKAA